MVSGSGSLCLLLPVHHLPRCSPGWLGCFAAASAGSPRTEPGLPGLWGAHRMAKRVQWHCERHRVSDQGRCPLSMWDSPCCPAGNSPSALRSFLFSGGPLTAALSLSQAVPSKQDLVDNIRAGKNDGHSRAVGGRDEGKASGWGRTHLATKSLSGGLLRLQPRATSAQMPSRFFIILGRACRQGPPRCPRIPLALICRSLWCLEKSETA